MYTKNSVRDYHGGRPTTHKAPLLDGLEEDYSSEHGSGMELSWQQEEF